MVYKVWGASFYFYVNADIIVEWGTGSIKIFFGEVDIKAASSENPFIKEKLPSVQLDSSINHLFSFVSVKTTSRTSRVNIKFLLSAQSAFVCCHGSQNKQKLLR